MYATTTTHTKYRCTKDFKMTTGEVRFTEGKVYEVGNTHHEGVVFKNNDNGGEHNINNSFLKEYFECINPKIKLQPYSNLPFGTYKNYTLLVAIANYSSNGVCESNARFYLDEETPDSEKLSRLGGEGGFMYKICTKDFASAYKHADGGNRDALIEGLRNEIIEL